MNKPNFLLLQVDQLHSRVLNSYGGKVNLPNIDELFCKGTSFESCTCPFPLCQPSRASLWSDRYPHKTNVLSNGKKWECKNVSTEYPTLGEVFTQGGYKAIHFGKRHDAGALRGFTCLEEGQIKIENESEEFPLNFDTFSDIFTTEKALEFFSSYDYSQPLISVVDLVNPHNICGYVGEYQNKRIENTNGLPPLPPNFEFKDIENRSKSIQYICCAHNRQAQVSGWEENNFRHYLKAYNYYLRKADEMIGQIINTLKERGIYDNTIILFFSDHGDALCARGTVTKHTALYQELVEVPLVIAGPGIPKGKVIKGLAQTLDIPPTLCQLAKLEIPKSFDGTSLVENLKNSSAIEREYVTSQWHTEWGFTVEPSRMIRTKNWKYIHYLEDKKEELYDLINDPYETLNVADKVENQKTLNYHRTLFKEYLENQQDPYFSLTPIAESRWRSHKIGYTNHKGIAAPQA